MIIEDAQGDTVEVQITETAVVNSVVPEIVNTALDQTKFLEKP